MILIQCTKSKRDEKAKARDLYDESAYFQAMRKWAEAKAALEGREWRILSAKHGLVHPDTVLEPYDSFGLSEKQAKRVVDKFTRQCVEAVTISAGKKYTRDLVPLLEDNGVEVVEVARGQSIGERRATVTRKRHELENKSLC